MLCFKKGGDQLADSKITGPDGLIAGSLSGETSTMAVIQHSRSWFMCSIASLEKERVKLVSSS
ncbi:hypothetical protein N474_09905 [Pseudoalteromonas luteoviolacea CPMOR-2]|uniref:Uncharacterized protein n=1 Tax=Pseudoalteromonas luteoviolacea DSM 6061 TaxID=1365250 RepID=A0A166WZ70_9GAMM|nr:hypothetical protein N475_14730 [Pseudoalteromonas luteoviolacea DSM 6061]KZN56925.1 hypothetical protein N474_09905 [Pseudoalteromonas luteoviolacea CPMOR-2]